jgi:2-polyprenyl-6-methoxyphenol hydroxylase-like FAD-dependent oxidoreductase
MHCISVQELTSEALHSWRDRRAAGRRSLPAGPPAGVGEVKRTVEIAGGGIAGLSTGLAFAQKGWRVRIHEQHGGSRIFGEGVPIWGNRRRVLDALGVLALVIAGATRASRHERREDQDKPFSRGCYDADCRLYMPLHESLLVALYDALVETGGEVVFNSRVSPRIQRAGCSSQTEPRDGLTSSWRQTATIRRSKTASAC